MFKRVNVANFAEVETAVEVTHAAFGSVDSLIVSAGIQRYGTAVSTDDEQWDEVMGVNLKGAWNAARAAIPFIKQAGGGTIVNVSSVQALASQQNVLAYTVSKHGLLGLTRSMAMDFAKENIASMRSVPERSIRRCSSGRRRSIRIRNRFTTRATRCIRSAASPSRARSPRSSRFWRTKVRLS